MRERERVCVCVRAFFFFRGGGCLLSFVKCLKRATATEKALKSPQKVLDLFSAQDLYERILENWHLNLLSALRLAFHDQWWWWFLLAVVEGVLVT